MFSVHGTKALFSRFCQNRRSSFDLVSSEYRQMPYFVFALKHPDFAY